MVKKQSGSWSQLLAKHSGKKEWLVVCNGPSLKKEDLEALAHLPSIASNKISLLFDQTSWRPSLYSIADALLIHKLGKDHYKDVSLTLAADYVFSMVRSDKKLSWRTSSAKDKASLFENNVGIPDPIKIGFIRPNTITVSQIQIAMWLGAKSIYVIGCDHSYAEERHKSSAKLAHSQTSNHFDPKYRVAGEVVNSAAYEKMEADYAFIDRLAKMHNVRIINISRKTALKEFELGTLEEAIVRTTEPQKEFMETV
tara:strand:+ start:275 stop:1036 length:762 start_codon:yes stop_codon:yes gene_type:complete